MTDGGQIPNNDVNPKPNSTESMLVEEFKTWSGKVLEALDKDRELKSKNDEKPKEQEKDKDEEPVLLDEFRKWSIQVFFSLAALATLFPLIANKISITLGLRLECAYHIIYSFYFLSPVILIGWWYCQKREPRTLSDTGSLKKLINWIKEQYVTIFLFLVLITGLILFAFSAKENATVILLCIVTSIILFHQVIISTVMTIGKPDLKKRLKVATFYLILTLIILTIGVLVQIKPFIPKTQKIDKQLNDNKVYRDLALYKERWKKIDGELEKMKFIVSKKEFESQKPTIDTVEYRKKVDISDKLDTDLKKTEAHLDTNYIKTKKEIPTLPTVFNIIEIVIERIRASSDEIHKEKLTHVLNRVFKNGLLFLGVILLILINLLVLFKFKKLDNEEPASNNFYTPEINRIKNFVAITIILILPIFRTLDKKNVKLEHPIWPISLEYIVSGGDRTYGPSKRVQKPTTINLEPGLTKAELEALYARLEEILSGQTITQGSIRENSYELIILKDIAEYVLMLLDSMEGEVKNNSNTLEKVKNK